jgi:hypothetical protein
MSESACVSLSRCHGCLLCCAKLLLALVYNSIVLYFLLMKYMIRHIFEKNQAKCGLHDDVCSLAADDQVFFFSQADD